MIRTLEQDVPRHRSHDVLMTKQKLAESAPFMPRPPLPGSFAAKDKRWYGEHKFRRYNRPVRQWLSLERDTAADTEHRDLMDAARPPDTISIVPPSTRVHQLLFNIFQYRSSIDHRYHY